MKKKIFFILAVCAGTAVQSQIPAWQQQVNYRIDVTLNDQDHSLDGFARIQYLNQSPDTLRFIWFHLWPNAYKNDKTAFCEQLLENGQTEFYFSDNESRGYINKLDFKVNNITSMLEDHPQHIDIAKLVLPAPLAPGETVTITTPFHIKMPCNFSRGGHDGQSYQATQWYPKPAVYDQEGWHPMPYLDQGEFYSDFGSYDVRITVPSNYVVAATGQLQNENEKTWMLGRFQFAWVPEKTAGKLTGKQKEKQSFPTSASDSKTLIFLQDSVHDFAWFADKRFNVKQDSLQLPSGKMMTVSVFSVHPSDPGWQQALPWAKRAIRHYSDLLGEYPWQTLSIVEGPESFGGGMEYPGITVISTGANPRALDLTIAHEIGHNWFYGILASDERTHPWMDEGMNSYYEKLYEEKYYKKTPDLERIIFETLAAEKLDQPAATHTEKFSSINYSMSAYYKTATWMHYLETRLGSGVFHKAMMHYYQSWKFKHPRPDDFKKSIEQSSGQNTDSIFSLLHLKGLLPNQQKTGTIAAFIFQRKALMKYLSEPAKNMFLFSPVLWYNSYDKLLAGLAITNLTLPPPAFKFIVAPLFGTGSSSLQGTGYLSRSFYPDQFFRKIDLSLMSSRFTTDEYKDAAGKKTMLSYYKIAPAIKFLLKEKNPRSSITRFARYQFFFIGEDQLRFYKDTVISGTDTSITTQYRKHTDTRSLHQLRLVAENNRALYPWRGELNIEAGKNFIRTGFTGNYFFNYPKGSGLSTRIFAGKFFYRNAKTSAARFSTSRYHLNMTGPDGTEDYTYNDFFIGRNKFEGLASQQIMTRDGAFKTRTNLLASEAGKTDDWLIALNFSSGIPAALNPLSILPLKIPLKIFLNIGTYAGAWKQETNADKLLFDAGLQIPLLKEIINIYIPLIFSPVFRDYYTSIFPKKERFWKKISFSIDITGHSLKKFNFNTGF